MRLSRANEKCLETVSSFRSAPGAAEKRPRKHKECTSNFVGFQENLQPAGVGKIWGTPLRKVEDGVFGAAEAIIAVDLFKDFGKGFKFTNIKGKEVELITSPDLRWSTNICFKLCS